MRTDPRLYHSHDNIFFSCVEHANDSIMISDRSGRLTYVNPAWTRTYGYSAEEAIGETPRLIRSSSQDADFYRRMWTEILDPEIGVWRGEVINQAKDGSLVPVLLSINHFKSETGETLGYMGIAMDLRDQKRMEAHLAKHDRLATIGELTSGLAHEIGTPMGVIRGRTEMLMMNLDAKSATAKNLDIILKQIDRITGLISSLLKLSRSPVSLELQRVKLIDILAEVRTFLSEKMTKSNIEWRIELDPTVEIMAEPNRLEQVLLNLLINSIYAITNKKERGPHKDFIAVRLHGRNAHIKIDVEDSGGGIPSEIVDKIFDPFFTTKPAGQGTGLGLSIVYRLMHEMEGDIRVSSREGWGTTFTLSFRSAEGPL